MPRRVKQSKTGLGPLAENFVKRLSNADARLRRKFVTYGFWAIGLLFLYSLMCGTYGIPRIIRLEMQRSGLEEANRQTLITLIDNTYVHRRLQSDSLYLEHLARTRYHMVRPGETIYYYHGK